MFDHVDASPLGGQDTFVAKHEALPPKAGEIEGQGGLAFVDFHRASNRSRDELHNVLPLFVTHDGRFHCDDVFGYVVLRLALGVSEAGRDHALMRTLDPSVIAAADYAWDVGVPGGGDAGTEEGIAASGTAGRIWATYGEMAVRVLLAPKAAQLAGIIAEMIAVTLVRHIDAAMAETGACPDPIGLAALVADCNLAWDDPFLGNPDAEDGAFLAAADLVADVLRRRVAMVRARLAADASVLAAHRRSADPRLLQLERELPWQASVRAHRLPVLCAIYPEPDGTWMVDATPPEWVSCPDEAALPRAWADLTKAAPILLSHVAAAVGPGPEFPRDAVTPNAAALTMARRTLDVLGRVDPGDGQGRM